MKPEINRPKYLRMHHAHTALFDVIRGVAASAMDARAYAQGLHQQLFDDSKLRQQWYEMPIQDLAKLSTDELKSARVDRARLQDVLEAYEVVEDLRQQTVPLNERLHAEGDLHHRMEDFVKDGKRSATPYAPGPASTPMNTPFSAKLDALRAQIAPLQREHGGVEAQTKSRAEVEEAIPLLCAQLAITGGTRIESALWQWAHSHRTQDNPFAIDVRVNSAADTDPLLAALFGADAIAAGLLKFVAAAVPVGLDAPKRAARLAEIAKALDKLEVEEESEIERLEAAGMSVARRKNARPEIVLAVRK